MKLRSRQRRSAWSVALPSAAPPVVLLSLLAACAPESAPLPAAAAVDAAVSVAPPAPLYQALYDAPPLGGGGAAGAQVRLLLWLRYVELRPEQLEMLASARAVVVDRTARIEAAELAEQQQQLAAEAPLYDTLLAGLSAGLPPDDAQLTAAGAALLELRQGTTNTDGTSSEGSDAARLRARADGVRAALDSLQPLLQALDPEQQARLGEATFVLRGQLDPIANPGDFNALVGTTWEPGQNAVLGRGSSAWSNQPNNLAGLWADAPPLEGPALQEARREALLYLLVLDPELDAAITIAKGWPATAATAAPPAGDQPGAPPPGSPVAPPPGSPVAPPPGSPVAPPPRSPSAPAPGTPAAPTPLLPGTGG
jgi:hypothetical protein